MCFTVMLFRTIFVELLAQTGSHKTSGKIVAFVCHLLHSCFFVLWSIAVVLFCRLDLLCACSYCFLWFAICLVLWCSINCALAFTAFVVCVRLLCCSLTVIYCLFVVLLLIGAVLSLFCCLFSWCFVVVLLFVLLLPLLCLFFVLVALLFFVDAAVVLSLFVLFCFAA